MEMDLKVTGRQQLPQGNISTGADYKLRELEFKQVLEHSLKRTELRFSRHASERMTQRGILMSTTMLEQLQSAVETAREKGARDVAVIGEKGIFIVNVPNNVVVTSMTNQELKDNIITNIDSAVLM